MNKPGILVATLLAGNLFLAACSGSRTPSGTNTASADNAATTSDTRAVGNSAGSIQSGQLEAERVGTGTASGSMVTVNATPAVTVPLGGSGNASTSTDPAQSGGSTSGTSGMTTMTTPAVSSPMTDPTGKTTGQPSPQTQNPTAQASPTGATPMGDENWSANRNNPSRQSDKMDNNGINADNNTGMGRTTPATVTPASSDNQRMRTAQRRGTDDAQVPTSTSSPTTTAPPNSVQDRERMGRDAVNPAGMEQRTGMTDYGTPEERTMPPMVSNQAEAIDRITTRLDEIDVALESKMSSRRKATLLRERKKLVYRLGTLKAIEMPATPNQIPTGPGGAQRP